jgi:ABC-type transporter Mla subunit MlaD
MKSSHRQSPVTPRQALADLTALTDSLRADIAELADHADELGQQLEHVQSLVQALKRLSRDQET